MEFLFINILIKCLVEGKLGFIPGKIILAGDSAGGNLATALQMKINMKNYRSSDGHNYFL